MGRNKILKINSVSIFVLYILMGVFCVFATLENNRLKSGVQSLEGQSRNLSMRIYMLENLEMMRLDPEFREKQKQYKEKLERRDDVPDEVGIRLPQ